MNPALRSSILLSLQEDSEFLLKTQKQIAKDFLPFVHVFPADFQSVAFTVDQIFELVHDNVSKMMEKSETTFLQFLYGIDLPENEFLALTSSKEFIAEISKKIVIREAYKVYLKSKYSQ